MLLLFLQRCNCFAVVVLGGFLVACFGSTGDWTQDFYTEIRSQLFFKILSQGLANSFSCPDLTWTWQSSFLSFPEHWDCKCTSSQPTKKMVFLIQLHKFHYCQMLWFEHSWMTCREDLHLSLASLLQLHSSVPIWSSRADVDSLRNTQVA